MDDTIIESGRVISRETTIILTGTTTTTKTNGLSAGGRESLTLSSFTSTTAVCAGTGTGSGAARSGGPLPSTPRRTELAAAAGSGLDSAERYANMDSAANMTPELVDGHQEEHNDHHHYHEQDQTPFEPLVDIEGSPDPEPVQHRTSWRIRTPDIPPPPPPRKSSSSSEPSSQNGRLSPLSRLFDMDEGADGPDRLLQNNTESRPRVVSRDSRKVDSRGKSSSPWRSNGKASGYNQNNNDDDDEEIHIDDDDEEQDFYRRGYQTIQDNIYKGANTGNSPVDDCLPCQCKFNPHVDPRWKACGPDCINRNLLVECIEDDCPCGSYCLNRRFQMRQNARVDVVKTEKKGFGLRAREDLPTGSFVMEYIGEVLPYANFVKRTREYSNAGVEHFYFMSLQSDEVIDATKKGCLARFINHSCNPNCHLEKWVVGSKLRIGIFTIKPVRNGEELTFDYQFERYGVEAQKCYCGWPNCNGYIGGNKRTSAMRMNSFNDLVEDEDADEIELDDEIVLTIPKKNKVRDGDYEDSYEPRRTQGIEDPALMERLARVMFMKPKVQKSKRLLAKLMATTERACLRRFLVLHGLVILKSWLRHFKDEEDIVMGIMFVLPRIPLLSRNSIEDSQIEEAVQEVAEGPESPSKGMAQAVLAEWKELKSTYRIPKAKKTPVATPTEAVSTPNSDSIGIFSPTERDIGTNSPVDVASNLGKRLSRFDESDAVFGGAGAEKRSRFDEHPNQTTVPTYDAGSTPTQYMTDFNQQPQEHEQASNPVALGPNDTFASAETYGGDHHDLEYERREYYRQAEYRKEGYYDRPHGPSYPRSESYGSSGNYEPTQGRAQESERYEPYRVDRDRDRDRERDRERERERERYRDYYYEDYERDREREGRGLPRRDRRDKAPRQPIAFDLRGREPRQRSPPAATVTDGSAAQPVAQPVVEADSVPAAQLDLNEVTTPEPAVTAIAAPSDEPLQRTTEATVETAAQPNQAVSVAEDVAQSTTKDSEPQISGPNDYDRPIRARDYDDDEDRYSRRHSSSSHHYPPSRRYSPSQFPHPRYFARHPPSYRSSNRHSGPSASALPGLPPHWRKASDTEGRIYYYNEISRETQWDAPKMEPVETPPPPPPPAPPVHPYYQEAGPIPPTQPMSMPMYSTAGPSSARTPVEQTPFAFTSPIPQPSTSRSASKKGMSEKDLKAAISATVVKNLAKYKIKLGSTEAFKKHARRMTHLIADKEMRYKAFRSGQLSEISTSMKTKIHKFVKDYMAKLFKKQPLEDQRSRSSIVELVYGKKSADPHTIFHGTDTTVIPPVVAAAIGLQLGGTGRSSMATASSTVSGSSSSFSLATTTTAAGKAAGSGQPGGLNYGNVDVDDEEDVKYGDDDEDDDVDDDDVVGLGRDRDEDDDDEGGIAAVPSVSV
ncbi:histone methyltransferase set2 [Linnemannia hyalina]|uniref:[histone H3]-lysine(36) N-trimethyltransferase n=1 Tax=Linnemannia hyalina TaxID=64524 RepID=A0A9P7XUB7_9FUNG|nr:histone methyltransferase set2 [Linnemannia hyalina]